MNRTAARRIRTAFFPPAFRAGRSRSAAGQHAQHPTRPRNPRLLLGIAGLAGLVLVFYIGTRFFGLVRGEEFTPDLFQRRTFEYYEIPLIRIQVTPIARQDNTNSLERYLRGQKFVPAARPTPPRWDLVSCSQAGRGVAVGDADILCAYLDAKDAEDTYVWRTWTEKHADLAKILWVEADHLADQRLYLLIPDLFELAARAADTAKFHRTLRQTMADRCETLARAQHELGHHHAALQLLDEALRYAPQRQSLWALHQLFSQPDPAQPRSPHR